MVHSQDATADASYMGVGLVMHLGRVPGLCSADNICVSFVCVQVEALRLWRTCASYKCAVGVSLDDAYPALWVILAVPNWAALSIPAESGSVAQSRLVHMRASAETLMVASEILLQAGYALSFPDNVLVFRCSGTPVQCVFSGVVEMVWLTCQVCVFLRQSLQVDASQSFGGFHSKNLGRCTCRNNPGHYSILC